MVEPFILGKILGKCLLYFRRVTGIGFIMYGGLRGLSFLFQEGYKDWIYYCRCKG